MNAPRVADDLLVEALKSEALSRYYAGVRIPDIVAEDDTFWRIVLEMVDTVAERQGWSLVKRR